MIEFLPHPGTLCVIATISESVSEFVYCYRDGDDPRHYKSICRMSDFVVKPHFGGFVLTNIGVARIEGMTMFPLVEHAHLCRWDELRAIKNLWEKQSADPKRTYHSFTDWIASLLSDPTIPESIKQKISHISDNS